MVKAGSHKLLTNIISLVRYALEETERLEPYSETINNRYEQWLSDQKASGRDFTEEQVEWLNMIKDHIVTSMAIETDDFEDTPFNAKGGQVRVYQLFGNELNEILNGLNEALAA